VAASPTIIRDLRGRSVGFLDDDAVRDASGDAVARPVLHGDERDVARLARVASRTMGGARSQGLNGNKVLLDLAPGDVATAQTEADYGTPLTEFIADTVCPVRMVSHDRGYYYLENIGNTTQLVLCNTSTDGEPPEINPGFAKTLFQTTGYALAAKLPKELLANADFDLKARVLRLLCEKLMLAREVRVATLLTTSTNYAAANRVAAAAKWNGAVTTSINVLGDLFAAMALSYLPANTVVLSEGIAQYFFQQTAAGPAGAGTQQPTSVRDYVMAGGKLPKQVYAPRQYLSGGSLAYVWSPAKPANVPVLRVVEDPVSDVGTAVTFRWTGSKGAKDIIDTVNGVMVRFYWHPQDMSYWMVVAHNDVDVILSNQVGAVITGALA
jgi:hypothetical protein